MCVASMHVTYAGCQTCTTPEGVTCGIQPCILEGPPLSNSKSTRPSSCYISVTCAYQ